MSHQLPVRLWPTPGWPIHSCALESSQHVWHHEERGRAQERQLCFECRVCITCSYVNRRFHPKRFLTLGSNCSRARATVHATQQTLSSTQPALRRCSTRTNVTSSRNYSRTSIDVRPQSIELLQLQLEAFMRSFIRLGLRVGDRLQSVHTYMLHSRTFEYSMAGAQGRTSIKRPTALGDATNGA